ncbi:extracellular solute-binding protein, partial [Acinetobacter baumannii]
TIDDVIQNKAGGYTGSSGDQADLDFSIVGAIEQPAWKNGTESKPVARALILSILAKSSEEKQAGAYDFMKYFTNVENQVKWSMSTGYVPVNKGV